MKKFLQRAAVALSLLTFGVFSSCTFISEREDLSSVSSGQVPVTIDLSVISQALSSMRAISADTATAASNLTIYCNAALTGVSDESYSKSKETGIALGGSTSSVQLSFNDVPAGKSYKISIGVYSESSKKGVEFASGSSESFTVAADTTSAVSVKLALNSDLQGSYFVAQGASGDGTFLNPGSIDSALSMLKSQKEGGTARIYLLSDVNYTGENAFEAPDNLSEFTFDLGGHTLTINKVLKRSDFESAPTIFSVRYCNNANIRNGTIKTDSSLDWYPSLYGLCNFDSYNDLTNPDYVYNLSDLTFSGFNMTVPSDDDSEYSILYCRGIITNVSNITITDCSGFSMAVFADATLTLSGDNNLSDLYISSQQPTTIKKDFTLNSDSCITFSNENLLFLEAALSADINVDSTELSNGILEAQTGLFAENSYIDTDHIVLVDTLDGYYVAPSGAVLPEQELKYGYGTNYCVSIQYANDPYALTITNSPNQWTSAIDHNGQIYVLYYDSTSEKNYLYFAGSSFAISDTTIGSGYSYNHLTILAGEETPIIGLYDSAERNMTFYKVSTSSDPDEESASLTKIGYISDLSLTKSIAAYKNSSGETIICLAKTTEESITNADEDTKNKRKIYEDVGTNETTTYYYTGYDVNILKYKLNGSETAASLLSTISIPASTIFPSVDLAFHEYAEITDMYITEDGSTMYALFKDEDSESESILVKGLIEHTDNYHSAASRGAMLQINLSSDSITKIYGATAMTGTDVWIQGTLLSNAFYGPYTTGSYSTIGTFVAPAKFVAIKPKKITIADRGRKLTNIGDETKRGEGKKVSGKAIFTLSSGDLTFATPESYYTNPDRGIDNYAGNGSTANITEYFYMSSAAGTLYIEFSEPLNTTGY